MIASTIKFKQFTKSKHVFIEARESCGSMQSKPMGTLFGVLTLAIVTIAPPAFAATTLIQMSSGGMSEMSGQNSSMGQMSMENMTMNQKVYQVNANGTTFQVIVGSNGDLPDNIQFDQDKRSLIFDAVGLTSRNLIHYEITVPTTLLSENFTVYLGGVHVTALPVANDTSTTIHITIPNSFIKTNNLSDSATLTVVATQAVPEFPIGATVGMFAAFVALIVIIVRNNKLNTRF